MLSLAFLLISSFCLLTTTHGYSQYCHLPSCRGAPHTMCIYSSSPNYQCGQCYQIGLSQAEKNAILNMHNSFRNNVANGYEYRGAPGPQPRAIPGAMKNFVWNHELESIAQRWSNQCKNGHDGCRDTHYYTVNQNVAVEWNSQPSQINPITMVQRWYNEVSSFHRNMVKSYRFNWGTGHYSQIVWGNTNQIGCGYVKCAKNNGVHYGYLVCNYAPAGNYESEPVYHSY